jgi:hypothetical protein
MLVYQRVQFITPRSQARSTGKLLESAALANRPDLAEKWLTAFWPPGHQGGLWQGGCTAQHGNMEMEDWEIVVG